MFARLSASAFRAAAGVKPTAHVLSSRSRLGLGLSGSAAALSFAAGVDGTAVAAAEMLPPAAQWASPQDELSWNRMIHASLPAVVSIKVNRVRAFDTSTAGTVQATGFVVDKERGFILTNRHVVTGGPVNSTAV